MAPGLTSELPVHSLGPQDGSGHVKSVYPKPLKVSGALERFTYEDTTPVIGREFLNVNIVDDLLNSANADQLLRDLAITSKSHCAADPRISTDELPKFPSAVLSSSAPKTILPMIYKSNLFIVWASLVASLLNRLCISIRY
jgi:hypothetical protein